MDHEDGDEDEQVWIPKIPSKIAKEISAQWQTEKFNHPTLPSTHLPTSIYNLPFNLRTISPGRVCTLQLGAHHRVERVT